MDQALEGVAERRATDAQLLAEGALVKPLARREDARLDVVAEPQVSSLCQRCPLKRPLLHHSLCSLTLEVVPALRRCSRMNSREECRDPATLAPLSSSTQSQPE
jgi:hypothetical protein